MMFAEQRVTCRQRPFAGRTLRAAASAVVGAISDRNAWAALLVFLPLAGSGEQTPVEPLPPPGGEVLLVVDGDITRSNVGDQAHFDLAMLQALPAHAFTTDTPWHEGPQQFEGVRLSVLLEHVGAGSQSFHAEALDDYSIAFTGIDLERYPVIIAYRHNGRPITRRALGPLRIVMPFDEYPALRTHAGDAMSIWQLLRMSVQ